jgi:dienelactone hydrolase
MKKSITLLALMFVISASAQLTTVTYKDGGQKLNGELAKPAHPTPSKSGILILPAWKGIDEHSRNTAQKLAEMGHYVFIADIYGEGNYPKDDKQAGEKSGAFKKNYKDYVRRISLALEQLIRNGANPESVAIIGFCFGGTGALEAARANLPVAGVVSFHGNLNRDPQRPIEKFKPKVLVCHGADDFFVPDSDIVSFQNEMKKSQADWQMIFYAKAVHSFTDPNAGNDPSKGVAYNALAAERSWEHMRLFFREILR